MPPPTRHAALRSRHPLALPAGSTLCSVADGSELIGSPRTNCATKAEQEQEEEQVEAPQVKDAAGCCPPVRCHLLLLLLSSASPAFVCPSAASVTTRLASVATPTHTHRERHSPENGSLKCFPFPGNLCDAIQLGPQPGHASVCSPSCVMDARHRHFLCTMREREGRGRSAQSGRGQRNWLPFDEVSREDREDRKGSATPDKFTPCKLC